MPPTAVAILGPMGKPLIDATQLGAISLNDPSGNPHQLGDYWSEKPVIVVFLRHFG